MEQTKTHPQKHVLVEHVSDDIRATKQSTVERQKVVLTAQAVADLLTGDSFHPDSSFDAKYFTNGAPDFNKVTDASIRWVEWPYVNGPEGIKMSGFLYTFVELPSGRLVWFPDNEVLREHDGDLALRQIFYIDEQYGEIEAFTRVGKRVNNVWSFSPYWHRMDGKIIRIYVGQEQVNAGLIRTANLRPDVIYEMHCGGNTITLPDADNLRLGAKIAFEQYANPDESGTPWTNTVKSVEMQSDGTTETYETVLVPPLKNGRTSEADINAGMWYNDVTQASVYKFDCVDREGQGFTRNGRTYNRTWSLDIDPEAITAMADITAMLGAHTDQMITDIVRYGDRYPSTDSAADKASKKAVTLVTSRQATMNGLIKFAIKFDGDRVSQLSSGFRMRIYRFNENTDTTITSHFEYKKTTDTTPSLFKKYYLKVESSTGTRYNPASGTGYIDSFVDGVDFYERSVQWYSAMPCATWVRGNETVQRNADFLGQTSGAYSRTAFDWVNKVEDPQNEGLVGYIKAYRNDTIMVAITSDDHYADATIVAPTVEFYPDPHDTYMTKLQIDNKSIFPRQLATSTTPFEKTDQVAGSTALVAAVKLIINQLQSKGMFWGPVPITLNSEEELDALEATGIYRIKNAITGASNPLHNAQHSILIVFGKENYTADQLEPPTTKFTVRPIVQMMISSPDSTSTFNVAGTCGSVIYTRVGYASGDNAAISWQEWVAYNRRHRVLTFDMTNDPDGTINLSCAQTDNTHIVVVGNGGRVTITCPLADQTPTGKFQIEAINTKISLSQQDPTVPRWITVPYTSACWIFEQVTADSATFLQTSKFKLFKLIGTAYTEVDYSGLCSVGEVFYKQRFKQTSGEKYSAYTNYNGIWPDFDVYYRTRVNNAWVYTAYDAAYKASHACPTGNAGLYTKQRAFVLDGEERAYMYTNNDSPYPRHDSCALGVHADWYTIRDRNYCYENIVSVFINLDNIAGDTTSRSAHTPGNTAEGEPKYVSDRMLYPVESDGRAWYLIVAS